MVGVVCDSAVDLPVELIRKYDITVLPCHVLLGESEYLDGVTIRPEDIFSFVKKEKILPKTSAPSIMEIMEAFRQKLASCEEVIGISMSDHISSTHANMLIAAQEMEAADRIHVIDSANLSTGMGAMVLEAAIRAAEGASADEIVSLCEELVDKIHVTFVVNDLKYLYMGGRCSAISALAGTTLKLHPSIEMEKGSLHASRKYRGSMEACVAKYAEDLRLRYADAEKSRLYLTISYPETSELMQALRRKLEEEAGFGEVIYTVAGAVISSHCGPDCMGIIYRDR